MTLGALIDKLYVLRQKRLEIEREAKEMKGKESELQQRILNELHEHKLRSSSGRLATFSWFIEFFPRLEMPDLFREHVLKKKDWPLMNMNPHGPEFRLRWEDDPTFYVPGIDKDSHTKISLVKAGSKKRG